MPAIVLLLLPLLHFMSVNTRMTYQLGFLACDLAMIVLIRNVVLGSPLPLLRVLEPRTIVSIGKISYGLYLGHVPVFWVVTGDVELRFLFPLPLENGPTLAIAIASYRFAELPIVWKEARFTLQRA